jgi:hypothetical protein
VQEQVLFQYNNNWFDRLSGSILVTDQRLVLDGQTWNVAEIASADLVPDRIRSRMGRPTPLAAKAFAAGIILLLASSLVMWWAQMIWLGLVLLFAGAGCMIYGGLNSYADIYRLQLTLKDGRRQVPFHMWYADRDQRAARLTLDAITQAVAAYDGVEKA